MDDIRQSITSYAQTASSSPIPPAVTAASLLYVGLSSPSAIASKVGSSGGSYKFSQSKALTKPSRKTCLLFAGANALGGLMVYDGDITNGAGFTSVWSVLYLLVNGRPSFRSFISGRVSPLALTLLATGNAAIYGREFFWPSKRSLGEQ